ncbi:MAG: hypothetical protein IJE66_06060, partial [Akkermansia sp.]|nr:hypothetical protein [Akkermansia sp.]
GKYEVKRTMDKVQNSARSARMMNDEGRLALVETICAQRSELFIRTSSFVNPRVPNLWDTYGVWGYWLDKYQRGS